MARARAAAEPADGMMLPATVGPPGVPANRETNYGHFLDNFERVRTLAELIAKSGFAGPLRKGEDVLAVAMHGASLGLSLATAMRAVHCFSGKVSLSADLMRALILRDIPGARIKVTKETDTECEMEFSAPSRETYVSRYSIEEAKRAGLLGKDNWKGNPRDMIFARCASRGSRRFAPDVLAGMYTPDELADSEPPPPNQLPAKANGQARPATDVEFRQAAAPAATTNHQPPPATSVDDDGEIIDAVIGGHQPQVSPPSAAEERAAAPPPLGSGDILTEPWTPQAEPAVTAVQLTVLSNLKGDLRLGTTEWLSLVGSFGGKSSARNLTEAEAGKLIGVLQARKAEEAARNGALASTSGN